MQKILGYSSIFSFSDENQFDDWCNCSEGWGPFSDSYFGLTTCFYFAAVYSGVSLFLLIFGLAQLIKFIYKPTSPTLYNWSFYTKLGLVFIYTILLSVSTILNSLNNVNWSHDIIFWSYILRLSVILLILIPIHILSNSRLPCTSGIILFFWLFDIMSGLIRLYNYLCLSEYNKSPSIFSIFVLELIASFLIFVAELTFPKPETPYEHVIDTLGKSPYESANVFSRMSFNWVTPLLVYGYKNIISSEDLPPVPVDSQALNTFDLLLKNWNKQHNWKRKSLFIAILSSFGDVITFSGCFLLLSEICPLIFPQLLKRFILFADSYYTDNPDPMAKGVFIAIGIAFVSLFASLFSAQEVNYFTIGRMKIKSALISLVYYKSLKLSTQARAGKSTGDIVNHMSIDVQRIEMLPHYLPSLISTPLSVMFSLISLYFLLGHAVWSGIIVLFLSAPLSAFTSKKLRKISRKQMKIKDERILLTTEILTNIKSIKFFSWESSFLQKLARLRNEKELKTLKEMGVWSALVYFIFDTIPFFVAFSVFGTFVLLYSKPLTVDIVFPSLTLLELLSEGLSAIPMYITAISEASVALSRLTEFFNADELQENAVDWEDSVQTNGEVSVEIKNGSFAWETKPEIKDILHGINLEAHKGRLTCIVGRVASGKSTLLSAMLGLTHRSSGTIKVHGSIAYVSQIPWIMNGTIKENIVFGKVFDPVFYHKAIEVCCLNEDLKILVKGDNTLVGEKGISLSGGQKARVALARAVYARADVYILDDPLSAVDQHVAKALISNVLGPKGILASKTRILATNAISALHASDYIYLLADGTIIESGTYNEVIIAEKRIANLINEHGDLKQSSSVKGLDNGESSSLLNQHASQNKSTSSSSVNINPDLLIDDNSRNISMQSKILDDSEILVESNEEDHPDDHSDLKVDAKSIASVSVSLRRASTASFKGIDKALLNEENEQAEKSEHGKVSWDVYKEYAKSNSVVGVTLFVFLLFLAYALGVLTDFWIKDWSESNKKNNSNSSLGLYLGVYFALGISSGIANILQELVLWVVCAVHSARKFHEDLARSIIRAPMSFFDTTPIGRIINRFSTDISKTDETLPGVFSYYLEALFRVIRSFAIIIYTVPLSVLFIAPISSLYYVIQQYYLRTYGELNRLTNRSRSPIYSHFQETLGGVPTIKAFRQDSRFILQNEARVDLYSSAFFPSTACNRWLSIRLEFIGNLIVFISACASIYYLDRRMISPGMIGLFYSYAVRITGNINMLVRCSVQVETNIVSVERILEYERIKQEAPPIIENNRPPIEWPTKGEIRFKNFSAAHREGLELALKNINLHVKSQEKIGIVGRTGAGKSTMTLSLFRIIEAREGHIDIDEVNISKIGLFDLRSKLSIIPQDSQAFEGTVRYNLDPTESHSDEELWKVLKLSHLDQHVRDMPEDLDSKIAEGGSNLSAGQRQLLSLARALLNPSKILILDEATSSVDVETDKIVQETIRTQFKDRTILTIAHRLNTIIDSDRIVVLGDGRVLEFDKPDVLLKDETSAFYSLVHAHKKS